MSQHREPVEVTLHILPQDLRRAIPARGFLAQRHHHNGIEVALKAPLQSLH